MCQAQCFHVCAVLGNGKRAFYLWHLTESFLYHTEILLRKPIFCQQNSGNGLSASDEETLRPHQLSLPKGGQGTDGMKCQNTHRTRNLSIRASFLSVQLMPFYRRFPQNFQHFSSSWYIKAVLYWQCKTHLLAAFSLAFAFVWREHHGFFWFWVFFLNYFAAQSGHRSGVKQACLQRMTIP